MIKSLLNIFNRRRLDKDNDTVDHPYGITKFVNESSSPSLRNLSKSSSNKIKKEYVINKDITNGREINTLPAVSCKRRDSSPEHFHYVSMSMQYYNSFAINTSLQNMTVSTF